MILYNGQRVMSKPFVLSRYGVGGGWVMPNVI